MRTRRELGAGRPGLRLGFTLTELLVVITIIGIIIAFLLNAAQGSLRTAQEKATQTLIAKLENGINDRLEALLQNRQDPAGYHQVLAHVYGTATLPQAYGSSPQIPERAYVIAMVDYIKRELPDVFFVQTSNPGAYDYPLNFASNLFPDPNAATTGYTSQAQSVVPIGSGSVYSVGAASWVFSPGQGIYGASYTSAAGLYKNLGYLPTGYDGVDNTGEGLIDEWQEGVVVGTNDTLVLGNLNAHQHKTARSEVLYALLVEGSGPFGSIFNRDEFTDKEVQDTDGDGLPEFVDAWGQPLQFYRWPLLYHSDTQRGQKYLSATFLNPYENMIEEREQNPLDLNQTLMAPAWWSVNGNDVIGTSSNYSNGGPFPDGFAAGTGNSSAAVSAFEFFFHSLHEPMTANVLGQFWDRGANSPTTGPYAQRRAYYSKPLIVSWGPDMMPGIFGYYTELNLSLPTTNITTSILSNENPAPQFDAINYPTVTGLTTQLQDQGGDDISNQTLEAGGSGGSAP